MYQKPCSVIRQFQHFVDLHSVSHLERISCPRVVPHTNYLDHQNLRSTGDESAPCTLCIFAATLCRVTPNCQVFGREIFSDTLTQPFERTVPSIADWNLQAKVRFPHLVDCVAITTGPLPLELRFEQPIDGNIQDGSVPVKKSQLSVGSQLPTNPHADWQQGRQQHCRKGRTYSTISSIL